MNSRWRGRLLLLFGRINITTWILFATHAVPSWARMLKRAGTAALLRATRHTQSLTRRLMLRL